MYNAGFLERLQMLLARLSHLGIEADIGSMNEAELWALYRFLTRLEGS